MENILKKTKKSVKSLSSQALVDKAQQNSQFPRSASEAPEGTYCSDGVQRVLDGQQQNFVSTSRVVGIDRPGYSLAGGEVEEGSLISHPDGLAAPT